MIYLDHAATTPLRHEVLQAMEPFLTAEFGNPSGVHAVARAARRAVDDARERLALVLGCEPSEVVFTGGGTEADNLAVTGTALKAVADGAEAPLVLCSAVEHPAVLEPVRWLGGREIPVDGAGVIDLGTLAEILSTEGGRAVLAAVMLANNETGVVQPLSEVAALLGRLAPGALLHTDAVQAFRWLDLATEAAGADLVSVSAHKLGGPKGAGALVVRERARRRLAPVLRGGPQEHELRAGTHNVSGIVGLAAAAELAAKEREEASARVGELAERFLSGLASACPGATSTVAAVRRLPNIVNVFLPAGEAEELLLLLDRRGVAASAGSACASGALRPSPVLLAMGIDAPTARRHLRFSLAPTTTAEEVDRAVAAVAEAVGELAR
jgi:cysteine desulfurase